jgi:hypothetical protein
VLLQNRPCSTPSGLFLAGDLIVPGVSPRAVLFDPFGVVNATKIRGLIQRVLAIGIGIRAELGTATRNRCARNFAIEVDSRSISTATPIPIPMAGQGHPEGVQQISPGCKPRGSKANIQCQPWIGIRAEMGTATRNRCARNSISRLTPGRYRQRRRFRWPVKGTPKGCNRSARGANPGGVRRIYSANPEGVEHGSCSSCRRYSQIMEAVDTDLLKDIESGALMWLPGFSACAGHYRCRVERWKLIGGTDPK